MRIFPRGASGTLWLDHQIDGQRIRRSLGTTDRAQAEELAAKISSDYWRQKRLGERARRTWDDACLAWLQAHGHLRDIEGRKDHLRVVQPFMTGRVLDEIDRDTLRTLAAWLQKPPANPPKGWRPRSAATVNRYLASIMAVLHYAHKQGWCMGVPAVEKLPEASRRTEFLTPDQVQRLMDELPEHLQAPVRFALATGLRDANIRGLQWSQVDLGRRVAWIHADQFKGGRNHTVPLNDAALEAVASQRGQHPRFVFTHGGKPFATGFNNNAWQRACVAAGLGKTPFHLLRHTWASWHVMNGTPLPVLQQLGGWASLDMVQRYAHLAPGHVAQWAGNASAAWHNGGTTPLKSNAGFEAESPGNPHGCLGWLSGLEPPTLGITKRSEQNPGKKVLNINDLLASNRRKAA